ncbi:MAG: hypothetical protein P9L96_02775 [Candidatus Gygaella obscura]|nr:hypothetical protein [Candidatus Gygaella obscura]
MFSLLFLRLLDDERVALEIDRYKWLKSERLGYDIGKEKAALEWIEQFGHVWLQVHKPRQYKSFLDKNSQFRRRLERRVSFSFSR